MHQIDCIKSTYTLEFDTAVLQAHLQHLKANVCVICVPDCVYMTRWICVRVYLIVLYTYKIIVFTSNIIMYTCKLIVYHIFSHTANYSCGWTKNKHVVISLQGHSKICSKSNSKRHKSDRERARIFDWQTCWLVTAKHVLKNARGDASLGWFTKLSKNTMRVTNNNTYLATCLRFPSGI